MSGTQATSRPVAAASGGLADGWERAAAAFAGDDPGRSVLLAGDGVRVAVGADVERPGASLLKLFLAAAVHVLAAGGELHLGRTVGLDELPASRWPSFLDALDPAHRFTVGELAGLALATGDNRVAGHLIALVGHDRVTALAGELGCAGTAMRVGFDDDALNERGRASTTTASDCERVLGAIATDPTLAPLRTALRTTLFGARIPSRLPGEVVVAHKTGTLRGVVHDAGVVHAPSGDFVACFLTDGQVDPPATAAAIGVCARAAYDAWEAR